MILNIPIYLCSCSFNISLYFSSLDLSLNDSVINLSDVLQMVNLSPIEVSHDVRLLLLVIDFGVVLPLAYLVHLLHDLSASLVQ